MSTELILEKIEEIVAQMDAVNAAMKELIDNGN